MKDYSKMVELYKKISDEKGYAIKYRELFGNEYGLPNSAWFVKHCPDKSITNYSKFIEWCGFKPRYTMSKRKNN